MKRLAIIPARGGSQRIKRKNIIDFHGKPMISYPLTEAMKSNLFDKIHVTTDDDEISDIVSGLGFPVEFKRDDNLADDNASVLEVAKWVLQRFAEQGELYDSFAMIMPCSPLILSSDLVKAYTIYDNAKGQYPVLSVAKYSTPIEWALEMNDRGILSPSNQELMASPSDSFSMKYFDTGSFSIQNARAILEGDCKISSQFLPYVLPQDRAIDIDELDDLHLAKKMFRVLSSEEV